ncbi:MAG: hypothetical protein U0S12_03630 [Fimbriimonadales bacterium]
MTKSLKVGVAMILIAIPTYVVQFGLPSLWARIPYNFLVVPLIVVAVPLAVLILVGKFGDRIIASVDSDFERESENHRRIMAELQAGRSKKG